MLLKIGKKYKRTGNKYNLFTKYGDIVIITDINKSSIVHTPIESNEYLNLDTVKFKHEYSSLKSSISFKGLL